MKKLITLLLLIPSLTFAVEYKIKNTTISKVRIDAFMITKADGGCLAFVDGFTNTIQTDGLFKYGKCKSNWVTLHCDPSGKRNTSVERGRLFLDTSEIGYALKKNVTVVIDSALSVNNYCAMKSITLE